MSITHRIEGGGGLGLNVVEAGNPDGPLMLFVHGWSQSHLCRKRQFACSLVQDFRLLALVLRGHGLSEKPRETRRHIDDRLWADDLGNLMQTLRLERPVLVGWSYGGFVISGYLQVHGAERIRGVNLVGAAIVLDERIFDELIGSGFYRHFPGAAASDLEANIQAMRSFLRDCFRLPQQRH